jgi:hypothetical protein
LYGDRTNYRTRCPGRFLSHCPADSLGYQCLSTTPATCPMSWTARASDRWVTGCHCATRLVPRLSGVSTKT